MSVAFLVRLRVRCLAYALYAPTPCGGRNAFAQHCNPPIADAPPFCSQTGQVIRGLR